MTDNEPLCEANAYTKAKEYAARIEQLDQQLEWSMAAKDARIEQLEAHIRTLEFIVATHQSQDPPESSEYPSLNTPHDPT